MAEGKIIVNAGAIVIRDGKILLIQEAEQPFRGKWNFPLGKVEPGELIPDAAVREVLEETSYKIELTNFVGVYQNIPSQELNVILVMFTGKVIGGGLPGIIPEVMSISWFTPEKLYKLPDKELFHPEMRNAVKRALENPQPLENYIKF